MKRICSFIGVCVIVLCNYILPVNAATNESLATQKSVTYFEDGSYVVTFIVDEDLNDSIGCFSTMQTRTSTKYTHYYNAQDVLQFSVAINATFTYNGKTAQATRATYGYKISSPNWQFISGDKKCEGATATATCSFRYMNRYYKTLSSSLTCAPDGTLS